MAPANRNVYRTDMVSQAHANFAVGIMSRMIPKSQQLPIFLFFSFILCWTGHHHRLKRAPFLKKIGILTTGQRNQKKKKKEGKNHEPTNLFNLKRNLTDDSCYVTQQMDSQFRDVFFFLRGIFRRETN